MNNRYLAAIAVLFLTVFALTCGKGDNISVNDGNVSGQATLPLLPIDLPIYPTDVTLDGLADSVKQGLEDIGMGWMFDNDSVQSFFDDVEKRLRNASIEILQPGVLSVAIDNQITDTIRDYVQVTKVGVNFGFSNDTDEWVSVPVEFKLYLGDGKLAEAWDESVTIPFQDERVHDGQFIVKPGEKIELSIDNVPHLVDALNNSTSIGVGYKALYRMADFDNGASLTEIMDKFGLCLIQGFISNDTSQCPSVNELIGWHLTLTKFELVISAESKLDIPEIPGCKDFANQYNLDLLKNACP